MTLRKSRQGQRSSSLRMRKFKLIVGLLLVIACVGAMVYGLRPWTTTADEQLVALTPTPTPSPTPPPREVLGFQMVNFDTGWIKYSDGVTVTSDGGVEWLKSVDIVPAEPPAADAGLSSLWNKDPNRVVTSLTFGTKSYPVKQSQFLTDRIGWALVDLSKDMPFPLLVTIDGGITWNTAVSPEIKQAIQDEKDRIALIRKEASMYADIETAKVKMQSKWLLQPSTASIGDLVMVRHDEPGQINWQGKSYTLQPFGAGYFTYLPVSTSVKAGTYPIGDQILTIKGKKFDTQYLQVTEQMESMRQDTQRIAADQKKIDLARSKSEPEFLFSSPFVQPVEGRLTTPYGYTRYVNNKYDSSHLAIDLAAKEGTPIMATNDGIVVLAETLYLTGNAIYLDHGMGLFSQYAHMSELKVKKGDRVKKGDIIGLVGTTGFSTGPHLHFTFWAHNVQANPNLFFNTSPFQWVQPQ